MKASRLPCLAATLPILVAVVFDSGVSLVQSIGRWSELTEGAALVLGAVLMRWSAERPGTFRFVARESSGLPFSVMLVAGSGWGLLKA